MNSIINDLEYDYNSRLKIIRNLNKTYPFLKTYSLGRSVLGKDLTALTVGNGPKKILFCGGFHGSEYITSHILLIFAEQLCYAYLNNLSISDISVKIALKERSLTIVPCINPDGCDIAINGNTDTGVFKNRIKNLAGGDYVHWNANARGVDINHNFPAGWEELHQKERQNGIYGFAKSRYGGKFPASEPETAALINFCKQQNFKHAVAFHSQGEVIYWDYNNIKIKNAQKMAEIMSAVSGYKLDSPTGLAVGGGFKDWFISEFLKPAFTLEIGKGTNPLDIKSSKNIYNNIKEMLMLNIIM